MVVGDVINEEEEEEVVEEEEEVVVEPPTAHQIDEPSTSSRKRKRTDNKVSKIKRPRCDFLNDEADVSDSDSEDEDYYEENDDDRRFIDNGVGLVEGVDFYNRINNELDSLPSVEPEPM